MRNQIYLLIFLLPCLQILNAQSTDTIIFNYNNTYMLPCSPSGMGNTSKHAVAQQTRSSVTKYKYNVEYQVTVNKHTEYIMEFAGDLQAYDTPARVTVASDFANRTYPLFITARQQKGVFSWQLPMLVQTPTSLDQFTNISRTLCPHNNLFDENGDSCDVSNQNTPILHLTSSSPDDIQVTILVETVKDFYIKLNSTTNLTITPSQPRYYFYPFKQEPKNSLDLQTQIIKRKDVCNRNLLEGERRLLKQYDMRWSERDEKSWFWRPKSVILMIESEDDVCAVVSIQNFSCPVFDNERDILYDGYYLTMTRRGGITLTQDQFPLGFYMVFIVKSSDEDCESQAETRTNSSQSTFFNWGQADTQTVYVDGPRVKKFSFQIVETISYQEYMIAAGAVLAFFLSFYLAHFIAVCVQARRGRVIVDAGSSEEAQIIPPSVPYDATVGTLRHREGPAGEGRGGTDQSCSTDTESENSLDEDNRVESDTFRLPHRLCLASLARKRGKVLAARSKSYLWNVLTVSVFYTLPVIQLVVTYQRMLNQSGNQDLCYFNFFCAHPLLVLSDFNHVFSNLGYVLLGGLFILQVWRRHRWHRAKTAQEKELGIPQHFGILYALGISLASEGVLSAAYHVCPNSMNFQFDTSFMYVTGVLCMVKLYQNRHPDINARAHATFPVLALIIFIGGFQIVETISYQEYMIAAGAVLAFFLSFYLAHFIAVCVQARRGRVIVDAGSSEEAQIIPPSVPHDATVGTLRHRGGPAGGEQGGTDQSCSTDTESENSLDEDNRVESDTFRLPHRLCLASLARKRGKVLAARSKSYLWNVLTVSVFYTLPVIQLVVTYQRMLNQSGNQDLCYFNFFCAHPLLVLSDFNHVFSNLGYVLLGGLFILQVWRRHRWHRAKTAQEKELGIPQHFGILYALGISLASEGVLSAAYHVCPNSMNFQFDTSFMYVTGVLCMVKLYQNRHPDINARAHATFPVLALIIFIGLVGVLNANLYFWAAFTVLHLTTCLVLTFQIYYMGRVKLDSATLSSACRSVLSRPVHSLTPTRLARCVLLAMANVANWAIAGYGLAQHSRDFASHLLLVLMSNLFLYTLFYIVMKLLNRETISWYSWVFIALTYINWFSSSYFFIDQSTNWALTPAQSRRNNRVCSLLQLYDSHDIWHFMSATAMFFSFNMYLTIDDNLANVPRTNIMVF